MRSKRTRASDAIMPGNHEAPPIEELCVYRSADAWQTTENENLSSISCEPCRQRKCKCDRKLPSCVQCSGEPSKCIYPESGKRGLPLGYLNQLEQRLSETETALYSALVTLRAMRPTTIVHASAKPESVHKQKAARMDEWNQLPLRGWSDMDHWFAGMSHQFTVEQPQTPNAHFTEPSEGGFVIPQSPGPNRPSHGSIHSPGVNMDAGEASTSYAWLRPPVIVSSPLYSRGQATGGSDGVASPAAGGVHEYTHVTMSSESEPVGPARPGESAPATRAAELSKNRPNIYF